MSEISKVSVSPATPIFATLSASPDAKVKFTGSVDLHHSYLRKLLLVCNSSRTCTICNAHRIGASSRGFECGAGCAIVDFLAVTSSNRTAPEGSIISTSALESPLLVVGVTSIVTTSP